MGEGKCNQGHTKRNTIDVGALERLGAGAVFPTLGSAQGAYQSWGPSFAPSERP